MSLNVSDFLIQRLNEWGIRRIYGFPGDGINGIIGAIGRAGEKADYIQVRHEEMSAFMACAHSKFTGEVGVCLATSGPGAIHLLNGLYDAKMDHQSVVAIVGQQARTAMGGDYQQEVDLVTLFKDVAGEYVHMATVASQIRHLVDRAVRIARAEPDGSPASSCPMICRKSLTRNRYISMEHSSVEWASAVHASFQATLTYVAPPTS